jgi:hypothetical protein
VILGPEVRVAEAQKEQITDEALEDDFMVYQ